MGRKIVYLCYKTNPAYLQAEDKADGLESKVLWILSKRHCFSCRGRYLAYPDSTSEMNTKGKKRTSCPVRFM